MYSGSVGIGGSVIGLGVVAGAAVTGNLPTTGFASILWAILAVILIFGGLLLLRLASLRRTRAALAAATVIDARSEGLHAALGIDLGVDLGIDLGGDELDDEVGIQRVD